MKKKLKRHIGFFHLAFGKANKFGAFVVELIGVEAANKIAVGFSQRGFRCIHLNIKHLEAILKGELNLF